MMTAHEISRMSGLSVRTLHHYDKIGLFCPPAHSEAGYRLYDDASLERLLFIMLYRTLGFPLKDIRSLLENKHFDRNAALREQIEMLALKKEGLENMITLAQGLLWRGTNPVNSGTVSSRDFELLDSKRIQETIQKAKENVTRNDLFKEYAERNKHRTKKENQQLEEDMLSLFTGFGKMRSSDPASEKVQRMVKELNDFITEHFYTCTPEVLAYLGRVYAGGGEFTETIDAAGGEGTGAFVCEAIRIYCDTPKSHKPE